MLPTVEQKEGRNEVKDVGRVFLLPVRTMKRSWPWVPNLEESINDLPTHILSMFYIKGGFEKLERTASHIVVREQILAWRRSASDPKTAALSM